MTIACPLCQLVIPAKRIDAVADMAECDWCGERFSLADLSVGALVPDDFDLHATPPGAWFVETPQGWQVGATTRSQAAFFLVPFLCVWFGLALTGLYGSQIAEGVFDPFRTLFGIPFIVGAVLLGFLVSMFVGGKVVVMVEGDEGKVFTGVGRLGLRRRFKWSSVTAVAQAVAQPRGGGPATPRAIILADPDWFRFGELLSPPRREYMQWALRKKLADRGPPRP